MMIVLSATYLKSCYIRVKSVYMSYHKASYTQGKKVGFFIDSGKKGSFPCKKSGKKLCFEQHLREKNP